MVGIAFMAVPTIGYADTSMDDMSAPKVAMSAEMPTEMPTEMEGMTSHDMPGHSSAPSASFDRDTALKISRDAIGNTLPNYKFTNSMGQAVSPRSSGASGCALTAVCDLHDNAFMPKENAARHEEVVSCEDGNRAARDAGRSLGWTFSPPGRCCSGWLRPTGRS